MSIRGKITAAVAAAGGVDLTVTSGAFQLADNLANVMSAHSEIKEPDAEVDHGDIILVWEEDTARVELRVMSRYRHALKRVSPLGVSNTPQPNTGCLLEAIWWLQSDNRRKAERKHLVKMKEREEESETDQGPESPQGQQGAEETPT